MHNVCCFQIFWWFTMFFYFKLFKSVLSIVLKVLFCWFNRFFRQDVQVSFGITKFGSSVCFPDCLNRGFSSLIFLYSFQKVFFRATITLLLFVLKNFLMPIASLEKGQFLNEKVVQLFADVLSPNRTLSCCIKRIEFRKKGNLLRK